MVKMKHYLRDVTDNIDYHEILDLSLSYHTLLNKSYILINGASCFSVIKHIPYD